MRRRSNAKPANRPDNQPWTIHDWRIVYREGPRFSVETEGETFTITMPQNKWLPFLKKFQEMLETDPRHKFVMNIDGKDYRFVGS